MPHLLPRATLLALAAIAGTLAPAREVVAQPRAAACKPAAPAPVRILAVPDGRTVMLADGRQILLAAIEPPQPPAKSVSDAPAAASVAAARAALADLVVDAEVILDPLADAPDRYGRLPARLFLANEGGARSVETLLVAQGHAYVSLAATENPCRAALLAAERKARAAKLGLWADPYYEQKSADDPAVVLAARGRFALVEGKVVSVRESGGTIYVNFGRRWSEDFTVTILKRNERQFTGAGIDPKKLAGRRVLVRGWIEERGGPWIEATAPEQIETVADR